MSNSVSFSSTSIDVVQDHNLQEEPPIIQGRPRGSRVQRAIEAIRGFGERLRLLPRTAPTPPPTRFSSLEDFMRESPTATALQQAVQRISRGDSGVVHNPIFEEEDTESQPYKSLSDDHTIYVSAGETLLQGDIDEELEIINGRPAKQDSGVFSAPESPDNLVQNYSSLSPDHTIYVSAGETPLQGDIDEELEIIDGRPAKEDSGVFSAAASPDYLVPIAGYMIPVRNAEPEYLVPVADYLSPVRHADDQDSMYAHIPEMERDYAHVPEYEYEERS